MKSLRHFLDLPMPETGWTARARASALASIGGSRVVFGDRFVSQTMNLQHPGGGSP